MANVTSDLVERLSPLPSTSTILVGDEDLFNAFIEFGQPYDATPFQFADDVEFGHIHHESVDSDDMVCFPDPLKSNPSNTNGNEIMPSSALWNNIALNDGNIPPTLSTDTSVFPLRLEIPDNLVQSAEPTLSMEDRSFGSFCRPGSLTPSFSHLWNAFPDPADSHEGREQDAIRTGQKRSNQAMERPVQPKKKRARIPLSAKGLLEGKFNSNPYPTRQEMDTIAQLSDLEPKTVKNWFSNARVRKIPLQCQDQQLGEENVTQHNDKPQVSDYRGSESKRFRQANDVHERSPTRSPAPSTSSLERYLDAPVEDEAASPKAIIENMHRLLSSAPSSSNLDSAPVDPFLDDVWSSYSDLNSAASSGSVASNVSVTSHYSASSRTSRQGRRRWTLSVAAHPVPPWKRASLGSDQEKFTTADPPFYCTFQPCEAQFTNKTAWARHEKSLHYSLQVWICCHNSISKVSLLDYIRNSQELQTDFADCLSKPEPRRTFYRRDHLAQHIKRSHTKGIELGLEFLLDAWNCSNTPSSDDNMLDCGFCGFRFQTWVSRKDHVAEHFRREEKKSAWWPGRKPPSKNRRRPAWSCRYLQDATSLFQESMYFPFADGGICILCGKTVWKANYGMHAVFHVYRECQQEFFSDQDTFLAHLRTVHYTSDDSDTRLRILPHLERWARLYPNQTSSTKG